MITTANTLLSNGVCGTTCNTTASRQLRTDQETVKNNLDALNNGASVIKAKPCAFKFYLLTY
ncbi:hypothetical protein [Cognatiluteimonas telluris]|uniref:hypothetical protein n=1 Tax=Cognatiluteimonas telluris TaxID=1104775 RepID=UPI00140D9D5F|nr:hypothetical protein [Lysobacter telluris]